MQSITISYSKNMKKFVLYIFGNTKQEIVKKFEFFHNYKKEDINVASEIKI